MLSRIQPQLLFTLLIGIAGVVAPANRASADPVIVDPPITVRINLQAGPRDGVMGELVEYDEDGLTLLVRGKRQEYRWIEITARSAFTARYRLIDQKNAQDWLALGEFAWEIGAESEAEKALHWALRLDESLANEAEKIRAEAPGKLRGPFQPSDPAEEPEAGNTAPADSLTDSGEEVARFEPVTPEQAAKAMAAAETAAERSLKELEVNARRLGTDHFIIFTDWEPIDDEFLTDSLEQAYRLVAGEFGIPSNENIFVGKLPVYMFDEHALFMRFAREIDGQKGFSDTVAVYYTGRSDGMGKLVMSKPKQTDRYGLEVARNIWRRNLTHEFAHAFFARYRSNAFVPRWLNEGLAEVIAEKVYPRYGAKNTARMIARNGKSISAIFDDRALPGPDMYPVMMTLVQALYDEDPKRFMEYIDRIKAGENPEQTLREMYEVDYRGLEAAWRRLMARK